MALTKHKDIHFKEHGKIVKHKDMVSFILPMVVQNKVFTEQAAKDLAKAKTFIRMANHMKVNLTTNKKTGMEYIIL